MPVEDPQWPRADHWLGRRDPAPGLVVVGVPTSAGSLSPSDAWSTPPRLREALAGFSTFDGEREIDLEGLPVADLGDWGLEGLDLTEAQAAVERQARALEAGPVHAFIGGDNSVTRPLVRGLAGGDLAHTAVITFDAHHDVRELDRGPTNGTPMRGLVEDGLPDGRIVQVGIHSFANSRPYREFCRRHAFGIVTMADLEEQGIGPAVSQALDRLADMAEWIHVDFDLDVLDRSFAPACPGSRPGGMHPRQLAIAAWLCGRHPKVRSADFVEVDATRDVADVTLHNLASTFLSFAAGVAVRKSAFPRRRVRPRGEAGLFSGAVEADAAEETDRPGDAPR